MLAGRVVGIQVDALDQGGVGGGRRAGDDHLGHLRSGQGGGLLGGVTVARSAVASVAQFGAARIRNGEYWFENPHATRLLFSSTAFPLNRGEGYYSNTWLFLHTFAAGLTDRFTLGGGFTLIPGIDFGDNIFYLMPKYTVVDGPGSTVALGALVGFLPLGGDQRDTPWTAGILYGVGTVGTRDSNLSLGLGWGYAGDELAPNPIVMVGGQGRVSRRVSLISENWFFPVNGGTEGLLSYGLRFLGEGMSVDLAWMSPLGGGAGIGFPWLGFAFKF